MPTPRVHQVEDTGGLESWFKSLPIVTRYWFAAAIMITCSGNFGLIGLEKLIFDWHMLKDSYQIWRLLTPFLYMGGRDLATLIMMYMLVSYSERYESRSGFNTGAGGGTADYAFALTFAVLCILLTYPLLTGFLIPIFGTNLVSFTLYIWTKRFPNEQVNVWGFPIKAMWLPFVILALKILMGAPFNDHVHGFAIGHVYYFLVDVVPLVYGKEYLRTPQAYIDCFGYGTFQPSVGPGPTTRLSTQDQPPSSVTAARNTGRSGGSSGHNWGTGRALGGS